MILNNYFKLENKKTPLRRIFIIKKEYPIQH
jgi:hypothetical protein